MEKEVSRKNSKRDEKIHIENPRSFMAIIDIICILLLIIALFLGIRYILNAVFISRYNDSIYSGKYENTLLKANFPESYLPYYNLGNVEYQNGDYDEAISYYKKALEAGPGHKGDRECNIRVNLALSMLQKIDWAGMSTEKDVQSAIRQLKAARNVLTEEGCANPDDPDGHNEDAEKLKKDIDDMLLQLQQNSDSGDSDSDNDNQSDEEEEEDDEENNDDNKSSKREDELKDALDDQKREGMQERQEAEQDKNNQQQGGYGSPDYDGKTW